MAVVRWKGNAIAVAQVSTITVSGTWATSDTATCTINGKAITVTVGSDTATSDIAEIIGRMINGDAVANDETRDEVGDNVAEFREITATYSSNVVTLTGDTKGKPFTLTSSEVTAGSGALADATSTSATGPNHFDNDDNWTGGSAPSSSDDIVFDSTDVDCKYGLSQAAVNPSSITITMGYTGKIGLADVNDDDSSYKYAEYRDTYLALGTSSTCTIQIGEGAGSGSSRIRIDSGAQQITMNMLNSGTASGNVPAVVWKGTNASNEINIQKGSLGIAFYEDESATVQDLNVGYISNVSNDATVRLGDGVTLTNINQTGGNVTIDSGPTGTVTLDGGSLTQYTGGSGTIIVGNAKFYYMSTSTITTLEITSGGIADFSRDSQSRTVTNCVVHRGGELKDPLKTVTWSNGVDLYRCGIQDVKLNLGEHMTLSRSAI